MHWLDLVIVAIIAWLTFRALSVGLIREVVTTIAVVGGAVLAGNFYQELADDIEFIETPQGVPAARYQGKAVCSRKRPLDESDRLADSVDLTSAGLVAVPLPATTEAAAVAAIAGFTDAVAMVLSERTEQLAGAAPAPAIGLDDLFAAKPAAPPPTRSTRSASR